MDSLSKRLRKLASDLEAMMQEKELKRMDAFGDAPKATKVVDKILGLSDAKAASKLALEHFEKLTREERERVFEHIADLSDLYRKEADLRGRHNYWERESDESEESSVEYESDDSEVEITPKIQALIDSGEVKFDGHNYILEAGDTEALKKLLDAMTDNA